MEDRNTGSVFDEWKAAVLLFQDKVAAETYAETQRIRLENFLALRVRVFCRQLSRSRLPTLLLFLQPYGISLNEVVQDWISRKKACESVHLPTRPLIGCPSWIGVSRSES